MKKLIWQGTIVVLLGPLAFPADVVTPRHGTATNVDSATKTVVVKTADGTEHTLHFVAKTTVHGADRTAKDTFHGVKEGSEVVAHYTAKGTEKTAVEVDKVGKDGMKDVEGTVSAIDRGTKKLVVKSADGTEHTFKLADRATQHPRQNAGQA